ncbi:hypothetical protein TNCV_1514031 [Trichonephila clavipes]|nr:hypothetical protein TNCV_1514031 [Trichonephila clavipes]
MKTSSVEFISRSPTPSPMKNSPLVSMKKEKGAYRCGQRTVRLADCGMQPKAKHSLRAQAQLMRTETVKTLRLKREKSEQRKDGGSRAGVPVENS